MHCVKIIFICDRHGRNKNPYDVVFETVSLVKVASPRPVWSLTLTEEERQFLKVVLQHIEQSEKCYIHLGSVQAKFCQNTCRKARFGVEERKEALGSCGQRPINPLFQKRLIMALESDSWVQLGDHSMPNLDQQSKANSKLRK